MSDENTPNDPHGIRDLLSKAADGADLRDYCGKVTAYLGLAQSMEDDVRTMRRAADSKHPDLTISLWCAFMRSWPEEFTGLYGAGRKLWDELRMARPPVSLASISGITECIAQLMSRMGENGRARMDEARLIGEEFISHLVDIGSDNLLTAKGRALLQSRDPGEMNQTVKIFNLISILLLGIVQDTMLDVESGDAGIDRSIEENSKLFDQVDMSPDELRETLKRFPSIIAALNLSVLFSSAVEQFGCLFADTFLMDNDKSFKKAKRTT